MHHFITGVRLEYSSNAIKQQPTVWLLVAAWILYHPMQYSSNVVWLLVTAWILYACNWRYLLPHPLYFLFHIFVCITNYKCGGISSDGTTVRNDLFQRNLNKLYSEDNSVIIFFAQKRHLFQKKKCVLSKLFTCHLWHQSS